MDVKHQSSGPDPYGFRRAFIQDQIHDASLVEEGEDPDDPTKQMALVNAVSAAADLAQEMGDAKATESNLNWMIQLCQGQLERPTPRSQFLVPLATAQHNLGLVQWARGRTDDAVADFQAAASTLSVLEQLHPTVPEHGVLLVGSMVNTAVLQIEQERYAEAQRLIEKAVATADRLVKQHPHSQECRAEQARCRELSKQFRKRGFGSNAAQQRDPAPDGSPKGCMVPLALVVLAGLGRFMIRDAQRPPPRPPQPSIEEVRRTDERLRSFMTTIEYVNDAQHPCTIYVLGHSGSRKQGVFKKMSAGPGQAEQQSTFPFSVNKIVVESEGEIVRTDVDFLLPPGGLSEIRVDSDFMASWKKLKDQHPPNDQGVLPNDDWPKGLDQ